jgi:radical SAM protein with 4Fe4S-binding SPASM domain
MIQPVLLRQVYLIITRRCNLECSHCIRSSNNEYNEFTPVDDLIQYIDRIKRYLHPNVSISVSGGEPCLHPDFLEIIERLNEASYRIVINTNGLFPKKLEAAITDKQNIRVQISIDGDQTTHEAIRGVNTWHRSLKTIKRLGENNEVVVATTVNKGNIDTLVNLDEALEPLPILFWSIRREVKYGRASVDTCISTDQWNQFTFQARSNFANKERIIAPNMFSPQSFQHHEKLVRNPMFRCGTGHSKLYINPDLSAFPCACLEEIDLGKVETAEDVEKMMAKVGALQFSMKEESPCQECPLLSKCQGGCPGASLREFGDFGWGDPRCPIVDYWKQIKDVM